MWCYPDMVIINIRRLLCLGIFLLWGLFIPGATASEWGGAPLKSPSHQLVDDEMGYTNQDNMVAYPYGKSEFGISSMMGFGKGEENLSFLFDMYYVIQPLDYVGLGVMTGFGFSGFTVLSASDQHQISTSYLPVSLMGRLNLRNHYLKRTIWYVYGMYGMRFQYPGSDEASVDGRASSRYAEWGLGVASKKPANMYHHQRFQMMSHYTIGWQEISFSGTSGSTFNSVIRYHLHMRYFTLRAIVAFTSLSPNRELNKRMQYGLPI
jgi:hypothetical protein